MNSAVDFSCFAKTEAEGFSLYMQVEGMTCAACAYKIESQLKAHAGVEARVNFSTQRLRISWQGSPQSVAANDEAPKDDLSDDPRALANLFAAEIEALGYHVAPFDHDSRLKQARTEERSLLACLAVAGFATGNIMLFSQALWFSPEGSLEGATRDLMHWVMGLIAMPATLYCGRPFFYSALAALRAGRTNMDVPISLAVTLANGLSLYETIRHGHYVYFDASVMLLFFLLIGRYLDLKARGKAREAAEGLLAMLEGTAQILDNGQTVSLRIRDLKPGQILIAAAGQKIAADGVIVEGASDIDSQLVTGETLPMAAKPGDKVFAGMINQSAPLHIKVTAASDDSLLSEIINLMERAEQSQSPYVRFADRVARLYAPVVHALALATFCGWLTYGHFHEGMVWEDALLKAMAVLIISCPCALGLAVPVVHVLASSELFRRGILLKSGKGLEALARIDTVAFDKTGTLTFGTPEWINPQMLADEDRTLAVAMARQSLHPLSQAVASGGMAGTSMSIMVTEYPGKGLEATHEGEIVRMGKASWLGLAESGDAQMDLWFRRGRSAAIRLIFADKLRADAAGVIAALHKRDLKVCLLSGDRPAVAERIATLLDIKDVRAGLSPLDKVAAIEAMQAKGHKVMMVGDGLNDAAALTAALVSMSPSSGIDITQNAADLVYRGHELSPVLTAYDTARRTQDLVKQNFTLSLIYNAIAIPAAIFGLVTPLIAALAMSGSSLIVVLNALRLRR